MADKNVSKDPHNPECRGFPVPPQYPCDGSRLTALTWLDTWLDTRHVAPGEIFN